MCQLDAVLPYRLSSIACATACALRELQRSMLLADDAGGVGSCEFTAELHDFLRRDISRTYPDLVQFVTVTLIEAGPHLLGPFDATVRSYVESLFTTRKQVPCPVH